MWKGLREVMRDRECTLGGKGLIALWSDEQCQSLMEKSWELCSPDLHLPSDRYTDW